MTHKTPYYSILIIMFFFTGFGTPEARSDQSVLDRFVGRWRVHVKTIQPEAPDINYTESYAWVLDHKFLQGITDQKPDGTKDIIYATFDANAKGYPWWIFSSSGTYVYLPPATWKSRQKLMEWESPREWDIHYKSQCFFPNENTRNCTMVMKDWKGKVILEQEWTATRIKQ